MIVLHDYFHAPEGGGRLALILAREFGADLAYGYKRRGHPFFEDPFSGQEHDLGVRIRLPLIKQYLLARAFMTRTAFIKDHDLAIYSGFYAPLAVHHRPDSKNICYCHTPPRFVYDQKEFYLSRLPVCLRPGLLAFIKWFQPRYETAMKKMNLILTNSRNVSVRIHKYLGLEAEVVYPPCEVEKYKWLGQEDYFLSAARLDPLKRVDVIVEAFTMMPDKKLIVISDGPEMPKIKRLARGCSNIEILGQVSEERYRELLGKCLASIYIPVEEDFGMTAVESLAAGKPVIAAAEGGLLEIIKDGNVGVLLDRVDVQSLIQVVEGVFAGRARRMREECKQAVNPYRTSQFVKNLSASCGFFHK